MSSSPPRMSGPNSTVPSRSEKRWTLPTWHDSGPNQSGTDIGQANPDARPHASTQHDRPVSLYRTPFPDLSPHSFTAAALALPTAPRSSSARLLPLLERTTTAPEQQNPYLSPPSSPPLVGGSSR